MSATPGKRRRCCSDDLQPGDLVFIKGRWQQALGRVGLELAGRDVRCKADPCPFKRMLCDICPFLEQDFHGLGLLGEDRYGVLARILRCRTAWNVHGLTALEIGREPHILTSANVDFGRAGIRRRPGLAAIEGG